jgi:hypothetical protein
MKEILTFVIVAAVFIVFVLFPYSLCKMGSMCARIEEKRGINNDN